MKRKKLLGKNLTFLITGTLAVMAFIKGESQFWWFVGVFAVFAVWTLIISSKNCRLNNMINRKQFIKPGRKQKNSKASSALRKINSENALLLHLNCRISDYLKSVYPEATWEWITETPETLATEGGTGEIRLFGVPDFNYAEIAFDKLARIDCRMIRIVSFDDLKKNGAPENEPKPEPENQPNQQQADPEIWYGVQGKRVLEKCVADLNAHGHANLLIKENGDICVYQGKNEIVNDKFVNLPDKTAWQRLVEIIESQGLSAAVANDCIKVSW